MNRIGILSSGRFLQSAFCFLIVMLWCFDFVSAQTQFSGTTMGPIVYNVTVVDPVDNEDELDESIQQRLEQINRLMSTYIEDSEVSKINAADAGQWIQVDPLTLKVIDRSLQLSEATDGAFDITVGPAVNAWKFGPDKSGTDVQIPDDDRIKELKNHIGFRLIETRAQPPAVRKQHSQTQIDLSAIAKGFAVDRVADLLEQQSLTNFMVEVGGEVFAKGHAQGGRSWRIGIQQPDSRNGKVSRVVLLQNKGLATSGDYRNFHVVGGKKYSHTIDPVTCKPVENRIASASILADDCMTADALATAAMVLGRDKAVSVCKKLGAECCVHQRDESDQGFNTVATEEFPFESESAKSAEEASIWPAFLGALVLCGLAIAGMAVGAIFNKKPITGSCGGIAANTNEDGSSSCSMCQKPVADCPENQTA